MASSTITRIQIVPAHSPRSLPTWPGWQLFSVGLIVDDAWIAWGECSIPHDWLRQRKGVHPVPLQGERITPHLGGQRLDSFRRLSDLLKGTVAFPDDILRLPSVRAGIQQALLRAVAGANGLSVFDVATAEYGLTAADPMQSAALFLDIGNDVATVERIAEMIALSPAGLGYRLVAGEPEQSIGADAEFLQQFVRELVAYIPTVLPEASYQPAILLRLDGALGDLTPDPRQHIGKVLGHAVGLEQACLPLTMWLADPIHLDDLAQKAATMQRLRLFMHRRDMSVKLVVGSGLHSLGDLDLVLQSEACDAVLVEWGGWADLDQMLQAAAKCSSAGLSLLAADGPSLTPAQLTLLVELFGRLKDSSLVVSMSDASAKIAAFAATEIGRQVVSAQVRAAVNELRP